MLRFREAVLIGAGRQEEVGNRTRELEATINPLSKETEGGAHAATNGWGGA